MSEQIETMDSGAEDFKGGELTHPNGSITRTFDTPKAYHQAVFDGWSEASKSDAKAARKAGLASASAAVDGEAGGRDRKAAAAKAAATRKLNKEKAAAEQSGDVTSTEAEVANATTAA